MKILTKIAALATMIILVPAICNAQNNFEGQIKYKITYEGADLNESIKMMLPDEMTFILKKDKSRSELKTGMGDQITIFDGNSKTALNLMNIMGQKIAIRKSVDEINLDRKKYPDLKVVFGDETKTIGGYLCKKASIEVNAADFDGQSTFSVYYTEELGNTIINYSDPLFNQIKGVMLEYEIKARGLLMRFTASEIKAMNISDEMFSIPDDYKEMTQDELKKIFGNNR